MTQHQIATLACKLLAVWMLAQAAAETANILLMAIYTAYAATYVHHVTWSEWTGAIVVGIPATVRALVGRYL